MSRRPETRSQRPVGSISLRQGIEEQGIPQRVVSERRQAARIEGVESDSHAIGVNQLRVTTAQGLSLFEDDREEEEQVVAPETMAIQGSQYVDQDLRAQFLANPLHPGQAPQQPQPQPGQLAPYIVMEDLPIQVPISLPVMPMYPHFHMFEGLSDQDPQKHVRDFANICVSNQVSDDRYLLIWFPTTLRGKAADWYWTNPARTFDTWAALRDAFLLKFRVVIDQRQALLALVSLRQEDGEAVSNYVARFQIVRQRCAANQLEDATISGFFLEGLQESVMREVVTANPQTMDDAVISAIAAERVEQMINRIRQKSVSFPGYLLVRAVNRGGYPVVFPFENPAWNSVPGSSSSASRPTPPPPIPQIMAPVSHTMAHLPHLAPPSHIDF